MANLTTYRGLQVLDDDHPPGAGGEAIQFDLKQLVDWSPKTVWAQTGPPANTNDLTQNFYPGSFWLQTDVTPPRLFVCQSSALNSAVWVQVITEIKVVKDTAPQLGGNLDVNGKSLTSVSNGHIVINPNGTGQVFLGSSQTSQPRGLPFNIEKSVPGIVFYDTDATAGDRGWEFFANSGKFFFRLLSDNVGTATTWLEVQRSGMTVSQIILTATHMRVAGSLYHNQTYCDNAQVIGPTTPGTINFDLALSDMHAGYLRSNTTLTLSNVQIGQRFNVTLTQGNGGGHTVAWWDNIQWPGGSPPTLTTTVDHSDIFEFLAKPDSIFMGRVWGQNFY